MQLTVLLLRLCTAGGVIQVFTGLRLASLFKKVLFPNNCGSVLNIGECESCFKGCSKPGSHVFELIHLIVSSAS